MKNKSEFITLMAILMSMVALTIDAMLPVLNVIANDLDVKNTNDVQQVVSSVFMGMGLGILMFGPIADSYGRKNSIFIGLGIFVVGCVMAYFAQSLEITLLGRFLQGLGVASPRVVTLAMIRDCFSGREMGKTLSLVMMIFVVVPALAPFIGQWISQISHWRTIYLFFLLVGLVSGIWLFFRQPETLSGDNKIPFRMTAIWKGIQETLKHPVARIYTLISGLIFGSFVAYLNLSQQIFQVQFQLGDDFPYYFGSLALFIGFASFVNSKLLEYFSMEKVTRLCFLSIFILSIPMNSYLMLSHYQISLFLFMTYLGVSFLFIGILMGNLTSLAVSPLGHIAGVANSIIGSLMTLISGVLGAIIGSFYEGTVFPLTISFFILSFFSLIIIYTQLKED